MSGAIAGARARARIPDALGYFAVQLIVSGGALWAGLLLYRAFVEGPPLQLAQRMALVYGGWLLLISLCMAVHEGGHWLAARLVRLRPLYVMLGPVVVFHAAGGARRRWNSAFLRRPFACAISAPRERDSARNWIVVAAGGPLASLVLAAFAYGARLFVAADAHVVLDALAVFALVGCVGNLVPGRIPGGSTDGAQILDAAREAPSLIPARAAARLVGELLDGVRPRALDANDLALALGVDTPAVARAGMQLLALRAALDGADTAGARRHEQELESLFPQLRAQQAAEVAAELAACSAARPDELDRAHHWRALAQRANVADRARADALIALAERRFEDARSALALARRELARVVFPGLAIALAERYDAIDRALADASPADA